MNSELPPRFTPLPIRLRPGHGEIASSYIRRLARANHLKPSFLHCYLCGPPQWFGKPPLENLATTSGHSPETLQRALADAGSLGGSGTSRLLRRYPRKSPSRQRWGHLSHRIIQDARRGTQIRLLAQRHDLRRWEVRLALDVPRLTSPAGSQLSDPITGKIADLIESMIGRGMSGRQIWMEIMDHHDYLISYHNIRHYMRYTRPRTASTRADSLASNTVDRGHPAE
ncbi:hypothetical protein GTW46_45120 [Streptomyces sp. SID6013]|nr:hypothetical protein [Streptomyces sp. SID6013]